jgi:U32 family peptidase
MAPAGSWDSLRAAIQGEPIRSTSVSASSTCGLPHRITSVQATCWRLASICKDNGLKSYLTVNVVVYDSEIEEMHSIIDAAASSGIDAVIASDLSVINYAYSKNLEIHLSTQLNISNVEALQFYSRWADVVVLARELDLEGVKYIHESIIARDIRGPKGDLVKIEMFAHGALCMAVSGKCYLSLHENNKSANRGECYQTCRKSYLVTNMETGYELAIDNEYIMSPKDLCTIGFIDKLTGAGVKVLKIEGRARPAEYVKTVCSCYNEALMALEEGTYTVEKAEGWRARLATVFNRGFWDGYYLGQKMGEWNSTYGSNATKRKIYIGKVTNYFAKVNVAEIKLENGDLEKGDEILIVGPSTGVVEYVADEIRVDLRATEKAIKGEFCSIMTNDVLRRSDKVYKWVDSPGVPRETPG